MPKRRRRHKRRARPRFEKTTGLGSVPGTVVAPADALSTTIQLIAFDPASVSEETIRSTDELSELNLGDQVHWVNVIGLGDAEALKKIGEYFDLHPLALEDVVNTHQRAKVEIYGDLVFIVTRRETVTDSGEATSEQISIFLGRDFVLTFQQWAGDCFEPIRNRIRTTGSRIRGKGADYLAYALLDAVIDSYFPAVEQYADQLDELEDAIGRPDPSDALERVHAIRSELSTLNRNLRGHQEAAHHLMDDDHDFITAETQTFLRDCYDHTMQLLEFVDMYQSHGVFLSRSTRVPGRSSRNGQLHPHH